MIGFQISLWRCIQGSLTTAASADEDRMDKSSVKSRLKNHLSYQSSVRAITGLEYELQRHLIEHQAGSLSSDTHLRRFWTGLEVWRLLCIAKFFSSVPKHLKFELWHKLLTVLYDVMWAFRVKVGSRIGVRDDGNRDTTAQVALSVFLHVSSLKVYYLKSLFCWNISKLIIQSGDCASLLIRHANKGNPKSIQKSMSSNMWVSLKEKSLKATLD